MVVANAVFTVFVLPAREESRSSPNKRGARKSVLKLDHISLVLKSIFGYMLSSSYYA